MVIDDTIAALSSPPPAVGRVCGSILRLSGPQTFSVLEKLLGGSSIPRRRGLFHTELSVEGIPVPAVIYTFPCPHSYTGQDMAELHVSSAAPIVERILSRILTHTRQARPGEFTLRAYLNGKLDLTQAEAVAQIVSGSNTAQVLAAEKLLAGRLAQTIAQIRSALLDWLSRLEAGLDFAEEDIQILPAAQAAQILQSLRSQIEQLLTGALRYERMIDLPSVGIAGAVNAGKSMLLNALLGRPRSIVSDARAVTRDVLAEILPLDGIDCVLFDCAGLSTQPPLDALDALAQQAARSALQKADLILFCIDIAKPDRTEDRGIFTLLGSKPLLALATQSDRLAPAEIPARLAQLNAEFGMEFLPVSALQGDGLDALKERIGNTLLQQRTAAPETDTALMLNQRHRQILSETSAALAEAANQVEQDRDEIAAMLVRSAWEQLGGFERENLSEAVLEQIFSRFCIGK